MYLYTPSLANGSMRLTILSLSKERGEGEPRVSRDSNHDFKIPLYPPEAVKKFSYSEAWG
jgi:hypothetical protein